MAVTRYTIEQVDQEHICPVSVSPWQTQHSMHVVWQVQGSPTCEISVLAGNVNDPNKCIPIANKVINIDEGGHLFSFAVSVEYYFVRFLLNDATSANYSIYVKHASM